MKRMMIFAFLSVIAVSLVSCSIALTPPKGFVENEDPSAYDYEAFSADNVRIAVTVEENPELGDNDFFYKAFMNKFVNNQGMKFIKDGDFKAKKTPGKFLIFETQRVGIDYTYIIGFVVKGDDVYVLEAGGMKEKIEPDLDKVIASFSTLK